MSTVIEKWDEILGIVKKEHDLSDVRFDTWLKPLKVYDVSGNVVTIVASDQVRLSYINKNYKLPLQVTISEVTGMTDCEVKFILPSRRRNPFPTLRLIRTTVLRPDVKKQI